MAYHLGGEADVFATIEKLANCVTRESSAQRNSPLRRRSCWPGFRPRVVAYPLPSSGLGKVSIKKREVLRARMATVAGLAIFLPVVVVLVRVWPATLWVGTFADFTPVRRFVTIAAANSFVVMASYFAVAALVWGVADAVMSPLRGFRAAPQATDTLRRWRIAHLSDLHTVGERYGFRIESGRAGPRGNVRLQRLFARLDAIPAAEPLDAVLVTGDITDAGLSAEWAEFFAALGYAGQEVGRVGWAEKSRRHRRPERVRAAAMVEAGGMAGIEKSVYTAAPSKLLNPCLLFKSCGSSRLYCLGHFGRE